MKNINDVHLDGIAKVAKETSQLAQETDPEWPGIILDDIDMEAHRQELY